MSLETATYISDLIATNPLSTDLKTQGDDHLRLIKAALQATFPEANRVIRFPRGVAVQSADFTVVSNADSGKLFPLSASGGNRAITLPATDLVDGFVVHFIRTDNTSNHVYLTASKNINGQSTYWLHGQYSFVTVLYNAVTDTFYTISGGQQKLVFPGELKPYVGTTAPTGWVRANGLSIGNLSSSATERANADTADLFTVLWDNYSDSVCPVSGGRGASAAADFAANKRIALPDLRGRSLFGLDTMGNSAAGRLGSIIAGTTNGASGGSETVTLTTAQMPSHTHSGTTNSDGASSINDEHASSTAGAASGSGFNANIGTTTDARSVPAHTHAFTTGSAGSGQAHSNMPPAWLITWLLRL